MTWSNQALPKPHFIGKNQYGLTFQQTLLEKQSWNDLFDNYNFSHKLKPYSSPRLTTYQ